MRKLIYFVHTSLDGRIDGPNGEFDWPSLGPELFAHSEYLTGRIDTFLYGRTVWEMMAAYWPDADATSDDSHSRFFAPVWRRTPKVVVSRTLPQPDGDVRVIRDDLDTQVRALKAAPGKDLLLTGGTQLASELTALGLIDEYHLVVHPVVLGGGKPLFLGQKERLGLDLVESRTFDGRTVLLHYDRPQG